ncbi:MAPK/MAK/MRK overlapping kinase isoform X2 [Prinia subflava]|uniref:MAPK/MAK/MRK overlapping kinase isoform X2 n=1 Tax=Prinia subflava TaxID=208062 RepID=UPI002FDFBE46
MRSRPCRVQRAAARGRRMRGCRGDWNTTWRPEGSAGSGAGSGPAAHPSTPASAGRRGRHKQKWDISQRWATRKHYNKVCRVHEAVIPSHLALSSPCGSFQPLFLGSNELDHVSKIHEVTGTPGNKTPTVQASEKQKALESFLKHFHLPATEGVEVRKSLAMQ